MSKYKIAVIVGSLRRDLFNRKLAGGLMRLGPPDFSFHDVQIGDLRCVGWRGSLSAMGTHLRAGLRCPARAGTRDARPGACQRGQGV